MSKPFVAASGIIATAGQAGPAGRVQLVLLLAGSCLPVLGAVLLSPLLSQISRSFAGVPGVEVLAPLVLTVPALLIALAAPFAGRIADAVDRKRLLVVAMAAYSIFGTAPLFLDSIHEILVSRALVGLCEAAIMTCCTTLIGDYWAGPQRARYLGLQTIVATFAATVFIGLGGLLGARDWRTPFWLYAVAAVLALPMFTVLPQPRHRVTESRAGHLDPMPWRALVEPAVVTVFGGVVFYVLLVQLSYLLAAAGLTSPPAVGGVTTLMSVATAVGAGLSARLLRRGHRAALAGEFLVGGLGLLLVCATASVPVITAGAVLTGLAAGALLPSLLIWAVDGLTYTQRGRGTGLWTGALFLGEFICPLLVHGLGAALGGLRSAVAAIAVAAIAAACLMRASIHRMDSRHHNK